MVALFLVLLVLQRVFSRFSAKELRVSREYWRLLANKMRKFEIILVWDNRISCPAYGEFLYEIIVARMLKRLFNVRLIINTKGVPSDFCDKNGELFPAARAFFNEQKQLTDTSLAKKGINIYI